MSVFVTTNIVIPIQYVYMYISIDTYSDTDTCGVSIGEHEQHIFMFIWWDNLANRNQSIYLLIIVLFCFLLCLVWFCFKMFINIII